MKSRFVLVMMIAAMSATMMVSQAKKGQHFNPMIDLLAQHKVIVGTPTAPYARPQGGGGGRGEAGNAAEAPSAPDACGLTPAPRGEGGGAGRGRGDAPPNRGGDAAARGAGRGPGGGGGGNAPTATMDEAAKTTLDYKPADFLQGSMEGGVDNAIGPFGDLMKALSRAGAVEQKPYAHLSHPFYMKTPKISRDPAKAIQNISKQLNVGLSGVIFVGVDCAKEVQMGLAAMRFKSAGGTRPDDMGDAPAYWGMSAKDYKAKADVWPLNPNGELVNWTIIESREGLKNVREIAKQKGIGVLIPGSGTLQGVLRGDPDPDAWEKAQQTVLAACKEFNVNCGFPASTPEVIEARFKQGFNVFVLQAWNQQAFDTISKGRELGGRGPSN